MKPLLLVIFCFQIIHCEIYLEKPLMGAEYLDEITYWGKIDKSVGISCFDRYESLPVYKCNIFDNMKLLVSEQCRMVITKFSSDKTGNWTCEMYTRTNKRVVYRTLILEDLKDEIREVFNKNASQVNLVCEIKTPEKSYFSAWSRGVRPDGTYFNFEFPINQTIITTTYSEAMEPYYLLKFGIIINLPLDQRDIGRWKIDVGVSNDDYTGCFFNLPENKFLDVEIPKNGEVVDYYQYENMLNIKCTVPWPIEYCFAELPGKYRIQNNTIASKRLQHAGVCHVVIPKVSSSMNGKWNCIVSTQSTTEDLAFPIDVKIEHLLMAEQSHVRANIGQSVFLRCNHKEFNQIKCNFITPFGEQISRNTNRFIISSTKFNGCELRIDDIRIEDRGIWKCQHEITTILNINLDQNVIETAPIMLDVSLNHNFGF